VELGLKYANFEFEDKDLLLGGGSRWRRPLCCCRRRWLSPDPSGGDRDTWTKV
jgi:hypothetical protein